MRGSWLIGDIVLLWFAFEIFSINSGVDNLVSINRQDMNDLGGQ